MSFYYKQSVFITDILLLFSPLYLGIPIGFKAGTEGQMNLVNVVWAIDKKHSEAAASQVQV